MSFIDYVMGHLTIEHPHQRTIVNFSETFSWHGAISGSCNSTNCVACG